MKKNKILSLLVIFALLSFGCSSDDNNAASTTPTTVTATSNVNWSGFDATQTDITSLVTIGGQPASTYTVSTIKGDRVSFEFNKQSKSSAKVTREMFFVEIQIDSPAVADVQFIESITYVPNPNVPFIGLDANLGFEIGENAPDNYDAKFNIVVQIVEDGVLLPGYYFIDPKIKIRASRE